MIIPDVNLLLYANITGFRQHELARAWWEDAVNGSAKVGLTTPAVFGFIRLATNRRVFDSPMTATDAVRRVRAWFVQPSVELVPAGPRFLDIAFGLLEGLGTAGNLTTDVQLAAHAIERNAELHSNDTDFARFVDLAWVNPISTRQH